MYLHLKNFISTVKSVCYLYGIVLFLHVYFYSIGKLIRCWFQLSGYIVLYVCTHNHASYYLNTGSQGLAPRHLSECTCQPCCSHVTHTRTLDHTLCVSKYLRSCKLQASFNFNPSGNYLIKRVQYTSNTYPFYSVNTYLLYLE